ncbi:plastocyanin/azurin family copper-binding protein [Haloarchaeobius sp. DFWS5]|uniref:plastocyanin/azurin family copper-binding protein n=1 Tax=Haloarchaeobius sp. DFWS5 TaxID=3446114 RepID=UPI003EBA4E29
MKRRTFLAAVGSTSTLAGLSGCLALTAGTRNTCGENCDIGMAASSFRPTEFTVSVGETVTWKNTSSKAHTVTAYGSAIPESAEFFASGGYDSEQAARDAWANKRGGAIPSGESFEHTFDVAGTYNYVCVPHERGGMTGRVIVEK